MTRPKAARAAAIALAAALALGACSEDSTKPETADLFSSVSVAGGDAKKDPTITVAKAPVAVTETAVKVLTEGTGATITAEDLISMNAAIVNATSGKVAHSTYTTGAVGVDLTDENLFPALKNKLPGLKVGSRVLLASTPADAFGEAGSEQLGFAKTDPAIFLIDIVSAAKPLTTAEGTAVPAKKGLPTVEMPAGKPAKVTMPKGAKPPTKTVVQQLITGKGPKVKSGQTIRVDYTGVLWKNGSVFDSSLNNPGNPFETAIGKGSVIKGWDTGLVGQPVGSRVLLIIPPADGYGAAGSPPKITGKDTLVFVVDILAAY